MRKSIMTKNLMGRQWRLLHIYLAVICSLLLVLVPVARAQVEIDITEGNLRKIPIAVAQFEGKSFDDQKFGADVVKVILSDLAGTGLFEPLDPDRAASALI